jgi:hypothetical protein
MRSRSGVLSAFAIQRFGRSTFPRTRASTISGRLEKPSLHRACHPDIVDSGPSTDLPELGERDERVESPAGVLPLSAIGHALAPFNVRRATFAMCLYVGGERCAGNPRPDTPVPTSRHGRPLTRALFSRVRSSSRVRRRGALSLRLRAQTLSRTGRGWVAPAERRPARCFATTALRCRFGPAQALENPTSPGTGEVASLSEPERALSRRCSGSIRNPL